MTVNIHRANNLIAECGGNSKGDTSSDELKNTHTINIIPNDMSDNL